MKSALLTFASSRLCVLFSLLATTGLKAVPAGDNWSSYLGGPERNHYSTLTQITPANVPQLKVAWEYHTGDPGEMQTNPLIVDGVLYGVSAANAIFALDAATGQEKWRYNIAGPKSKSVLRGLARWTDGQEERILFTTGFWLCALDARTGQPIASFGDNGRTNLHAGLGEAARNKWLVSTTPGTVFEDLIVMPTRVSEAADAAPGFIQAFNVRTGQLAWVFHTMPQPGEPGYETWPPDAWKNINVGSANNWPGTALDEKRGLLFVPTGSAAPDFWGGDRVGQDLYANCLLALDARTGKLRWHYQIVHHDLWDRDLPAPPNLVTLHRDGKTIEAVAQVTKSGRVFVFDRDTGKPVFPIREEPAPKSTLPGETAWPTQPEPVKPAPFARETITENDLNPYSENHDALLARFRAARVGRFEPFAVDHETLLIPGFDGGAEWGGAAVDADGVMYVNVNEMAWMARLRSNAPVPGNADVTPGRRAYLTYCVACHGMERQGAPGGGPPALTGLAKRKSRDEVMRLTATGKGMMPGFPALAERDRQVLMDYLFDEEKVEGPATAAPATAASASVASGHDAAPPTTPAGPAAGTAPYRLDGYVRFVDSQGYPAISPPWGSLTAIDLNTGEHRWHIPLGEFPELTAKGIPPTGTENYGGPVVTASGLLFIGASKDGNLRAFDRATGKKLWEVPLPAAGFATPSLYAVAGKEYLVIAAGGKKLNTPEGDSYIAYTLP